MTERATVFEAVQIGVEATPGTDVAANKAMEAWSVSPTRQGNISPFRPLGSKFNTLVTVGKEHTEAGIEGVLDYSNIVYLLASLVSYSTPVTAGTAGTPNAYAWTFQPDTDGPDTVKTYTVEQGSSVRAHQFTYGQVTGLTFSFTNNAESVDLGGTFIGQELEDDITMTATPTTVTAVPVMPKQVCVYIDSTSAGLGTTKLTRLLALDFNFTGKYGPVFTIDCEETSFSATVETAPELGGTMTLEADANGMTYLTGARAGTKYWMRIEATYSSTDLNGGTDYTFRIDAPIRLTSLGDLSDSDGVVAVQYAFTGVHDGDWGKAVQFYVINGVDAL